MTRFTWPLVATAFAALSGCATAPVEFDCVGEAPLCEILDVVGEQRGLAGGISITKVELFQAVQVDLMADGEANTDHASIVAGREALIRVHVSPNDDWQVRDVAARFYLYDADDNVVAAGEGVGRPTTASVEGDLASTINIEMPANMMPEGELGWAVELVETNDEARSIGQVDGAAFPDGDERAPFVAETTGDSIRIYLVPIEDSTGAVGDTSEAVVNQVRDAVYDMYPVPAVEIEVGEPFVFDGDVSSMGSLSPLLNAVTEAIRDETERGIDDDQFVFGVTAFSGGGLSWVGGSPTGIHSRHSVGSAWTVPHEVGHAIGRLHSPGCGAAGPDEGYPHEDSAIGVWGWSPIYGDLKDPTETKDFMSYCHPQFISDYVWDSIYDNKKAIHEAYYGGDATTRRVATSWRTLWFHPGGDVALGKVQSWVDTPTGEPVQVDLLDASGAALARVDAVWMPFSHLADEGAGILLLPEDEPRAWDSVRVVGDAAVAPLPLDRVIERQRWN